MASQESILIAALIQNLRAERAPDLKEDDFFELFLSEQVLKEHELTYDELKAGNIGKGGDGGIDSFFIFVNNSLLQTDTSLGEFKKNVKIELFLIQAKNTTSFNESVIEKFIASAEDIFNLERSISELSTVYNSSLIAHIKLFRDTYLNLIAKQPELIVNYFYGSKGDEIHPNVRRKIVDLEKIIKRYFSKATFSFDFYSSAKLLELARIEKRESFKLQLFETPIMTDDGGYICIAGLRSFYDFITDDSEAIIKYIFDANVRDHQRSTTVNKEINHALLSNNPEDFWWLNNGITILSEKVNLSGKILTIQDPQIVNGCQTSFEIYNFFKNNLARLEVDKRNIMVRVMETSDDDIKSRIIKSTNSQTQIPPASLRSTDSIHRNIEQYFESKGLFYDRRKNFWKNQGKSISSIITIPYLSQTIMAMILKRPDISRAKPSTLVKEDEEYEKIFNNNYDLDTYLNAITLQKRIETSLTDTKYLDRGEGLNIRWFTSMAVVLSVQEKPIRDSNNIKLETEKFNNIDFDAIPTAIIETCIKEVSNIYKTLGGNDGVAKAKYFTEAVVEWFSVDRSIVETLSNS